jgi:hypothetical protein
MTQKTLLAAGAALVIAVGAAIVWFVSAQSPAVRWSDVLDAAAQRQTLRGLGRIYMGDGEEWEYALWGRVGEDGTWISKGMLRPVRLPNAEASEEPNSQVVAACQAMDYCADDGIVSELARRADRPAQPRREEYAGRRALLVDIDSEETLGPGEEGRPDAWRLFLDPETKVLLDMEIYVGKDRGRALRGRCEYEYGIDLPAGFDEAPT